MAGSLVGNSLSRFIRLVYGNERSYVAVNGLNLIVVAIPDFFGNSMYTAGYDTCGAIYMGQEWLVYPDYFDIDFTPLFN